MSGVIKLSSRETKEFWEIPVLFEDDSLLALDKPARLLTSPDRYDPDRPNLMKLLHRDIERKAPWAVSHGITYLANAHRLDFETSGILLLAKTKPALIALANLFSSEKPAKTYVTIVQGSPREPDFTVEAKLGPHPVRPQFVRVDPKHGKRAITNFHVLESFAGYTLLRCEPLTGRTHQIRAHLRWVRMPICGDSLYHGRPLNLSSLKRNYRLKGNAVERPLLDRVALHAAGLVLPHPLTGAQVSIESPWPKDMNVALKYLRRYAPERGGPIPSLPGQEPDQPVAEHDGEQDEAGPG